MTYKVYRIILLFLIFNGISIAFAQETGTPPLNPLQQWQQKQVQAITTMTTATSPTSAPTSAAPPSTAPITTSSPPPIISTSGSPSATSGAIPPPPFSTSSTSAPSRIAPPVTSNPFLNGPPIHPPRRTRPSLPLTYEESQHAVLKTVPEARTPTSPEAMAAFNAMMSQNMPLSPQQVVQLRQQIDLAQLAAAVPPNIPPKPVSSTLMINLAPGTTPPAIRLAAGYVSALVFVDSTGSPWPISSFDIGNPKAVNLQWDGKTNVLLIQAVSPYSNGDIVIRLVGLPTPITLQLVAGQRVVDYRVDIHVSGIGPNTKELPMGSALPSSANQLLLGVLDGIAPAGSRTLTVQGADALAWQLGGKIYLRTRLTVLSPGWVGKMVSPDGMQAYELPTTSSVLVSRYGEPVELRIEGF